MKNQVLISLEKMISLFSNNENLEHAKKISLRVFIIWLRICSKWLKRFQLVTVGSEQRFMTAGAKDAVEKLKANKGIGVKNLLITCLLKKILIIQSIDKQV